MVKNKVRIIERNLDTIMIVAIMLSLISLPILTYFKILKIIQFDILLSIISPIITAVGVLAANRIHTKLNNPKLKIDDWDTYVFRDTSVRSVRIYCKVSNKEGRETAQNAKALITVKKIKDGKEEEVEKGDLFLPHEGIPEDVEIFGQGAKPDILLPRESPKIEGEFVPWAVPENLYDSRGLDGIAFKHTANIAPGQVNRVVIFEIVRKREQYYLVFFSEYGTEPETVGYHLSESSFGRVPYLIKKRWLRCVLNPGRYRVYVNVSADKAYPVYGILEVDSKKGIINFKEPKKEELNFNNTFDSSFNRV